MSKKKKVRKDIEKLLRAGRFWDLLRLMESDGLVSAHPAEYKQAWKEIVDQALRQEKAFERFRKEAGTFRTLPDTPDCRLLMCLKACIEGQGSPQEIAALKGLSPAAERLRSGFLSGADSLPEEQALRELLEKFVQEPLKITRRHFEQAAALIPVQGLAGKILLAGMEIAAVRSLNGKASIERGWAGKPVEILRGVDNALSSFSQELPRALRAILFHPFACNIAEACRRLAPVATGDRAFRLIRAMPHLLPLVAGEKFEEIQRKLLVNREDWLEGAIEDVDTLGRKVKGLSLEEKLSLLKGLRLRAHDRASRAPDFERPDFEDLDFLDDDGAPHADESEESRLGRAVVLLHRSVFEDISGRSSRLSAREKKELIGVMEPLLFRDLDHIFATVEDSREIADLFTAAIDSGCAGIRTGLLALLAGSYLRNGGLRKCAERLLDASPPPTAEDVKWVAGEWKDFYFPSARVLKPFFNRYANERELLLPFIEQLCSTVEFALIESTVYERVYAQTYPLDGKSDTMKPRELRDLRREMVALTEYEVLEPLRRLLKCYPEDRFTVEGHLNWLRTLHSSIEGGAWGYAVSELERYKALIATAPRSVRIFALEFLWEDKVKALWLFLEERLEELAAIPTDTLEPLWNDLLALEDSSFPLHTLLIRMEKLLAGRLDAGDKTVRPLMEKIRKMLVDLVRKQKSPARSGSTRKRRR